MGQAEAQEEAEMRRQDQIAEARKLLAHIDNRTTALADGIYRNPVTDYTCPRQAARERALFFENGPLNIGLGALLPRAGDWMTHDYAGVPILLVRRDDGSLAAFLNVCRHRGARIVEGCGRRRPQLLMPLSRLDLRPRRQPDRAARGSLVPDGRSDDAWLAGTAGRREIRHDLGRDPARHRARHRSGAGGTRQTIWRRTTSNPITTTKRGRCGAR